MDKPTFAQDPDNETDASAGPAAAQEKKVASDAAMRLFERMQDSGFAAGVAKFMSMSPQEMGEAARQAVAVRKASR